MMVRGICFGIVGSAGLVVARIGLNGWHIKCRMDGLKQKALQHRTFITKNLSYGIRYARLPSICLSGLLQLRFNHRTRCDFFVKCSPLMIDTAQSDGWRRGVYVLVERVGRVRYNRLEDCSV